VEELAEFHVFKESLQATILGRAGHKISSLLLLYLVSFLRFALK